MAIARGETGAYADAQALASQVHPVFMLPPVASSWFGAMLGGGFSVPAGAVHMVAIFAAVYTAHVKDGYVDFHVRDEDDDHPMTAFGCRAALVASTLVFLGALATLWVIADPLAVALTLPTWVIAYNHAPVLDVNPVGATTGYPAGVALAILGGNQVQAGALTPTAVGFAAVFLVLLSGVKVIDDAQDYDYDRTIAKQTVAVSVGPRSARRIAFGLMGLGLSLVVALAGIGVAPPTAALAALPFAAVALFAARADPHLATMLLVRGAYLFLVVLIVAVWYRPLS